MRWKNLTNFGKFLVVVGIIALVTILLLPISKEFLYKDGSLLEATLMVISFIFWLIIGYLLYPFIIKQLLDENDELNKKKTIMFVSGFIIFAALLTLAFWNFSFLHIYLIGGLVVLLLATIVSIIMLILLHLIIVLPGLIFHLITSMCKISEFIDDKYGDKIKSLTDKVAKFFKNLIFKQ